MDKNSEVLVGNKDIEYRSYTLNDIIPNMFTHKTKGKQV